MTAEEIMKALQAPFDPADIEWRVGATNKEKTKGIALAYVTNRAIMNRLDEVVGPFNWKNEYKEWKANSQLCGLSIRFEGEWITKWDGADDSEHEAVKGGLSDAMKRAGYQWGMGRYLYNLENVWVDIKPAGKSYALVREPQLPTWALPEGYSYNPKPSSSKPVEAPTSQADTDIPPRSLKEKFQAGKGSLDGFEAWVADMQAKGHNFKTMEELLAKALNKKAQEAKGVKNA